MEFIIFHKNGKKKKKKTKLPFLIFPRMYFLSFLFLKSSCLMDRVRQKSLPCYLTEGALSQGIRPGIWAVLCYPEPGFDQSAWRHGFCCACQLLLSVLSGLGVQPDIAAAAAAAATSLQSCPTLCDPIDGSPPGSPVPGILQARTLEWVAISFSNA